MIIGVAFPFKIVRVRFHGPSSCFVMGYDSPRRELLSGCCHFYLLLGTLYPFCCKCVLSTRGLPLSHSVLESKWAGVFGGSSGSQEVGRNFCGSTISDITFLSLWVHPVLSGRFLWYLVYSVLREEERNDHEPSERGLSTYRMQCHVQPSLRRKFWCLQWKQTNEPRGIQEETRCGVADNVVAV